MDDHDDQELLTRFVQHADHAAFAVLARRHAGLVYSSARRRLGNADLAHDVTQIVFAVLAKKADTIRPGTVLSAWLLKATRFTASNMSKSEFRRRRRELEAAFREEQRVKDLARPAGASADDEWEKVAPLLDGALDSLGEGARSAVVLRWFEGRSFRDVGERLGLSEEAAKQKVFRALGRMRRYMAQRGVAVPVATLTALIAGNAVQAAPAATIEAAAATASSGAAVASHSTAQAVATLMGWTRAKMLVGGLTTASVLFAGAVAVKLVLSENRGTLSVDRREGNDPAAVGGGSVRPSGVAIGLDGRPLAGASVLISTPEKYAAYRGTSDPTAVTTGPDGSFLLPATEGPYTLIIWKDDTGFAELTGEQLAERGGRVGLGPWTRLEGRIIDTKNIAGQAATIVMGHWAPPQGGVQTTTCVLTALTDADGKFVFARVPAGDGWVARQVPAPNGGEPRLVHRTYATAQPGNRPPVLLGGGRGSRTVVGKLLDSAARTGDGTTREWRVTLVRSLDVHAAGSTTGGGQLAYHGSMFQTDLIVDRDGSFRAEDVPVGSYRLVGQERVTVPGRPVATTLVERDVQVTAAGDDSSAAALQDLGTIIVTSPTVIVGASAHPGRVHP